MAIRTNRQRIDHDATELETARFRVAVAPADRADEDSVGLQAYREERFARTVHPIAKPAPIPLRIQGLRVEKLAANRRTITQCRDGVEFVLLGPSEAHALTVRDPPMQWHGPAAGVAIQALSPGCDSGPRADDLLT